MKKLKAKYRDSEAEKKVNRIDAALNRFYLSMEKQPLTKWEQGAKDCLAKIRRIVAKRKAAKK